MYNKFNRQHHANNRKIDQKTAVLVVHKYNIIISLEESGWTEAS